MKKMIISTLFFLSIAGFASAQSNNTSKNSGKQVATSSHKAKKAVHKKVAASKTSTKTAQPDNRKEFMKDGQLATPTGHEATPVNSDQFQSIKDSASKKGKKQ
jgi:hypothetical protein